MNGSKFPNTLLLRQLKPIINFDDTHIKTKSFVYASREVNVVLGVAVKKVDAVIGGSPTKYWPGPTL